MVEWLISCDPKAYDLDGAFQKLEAIDWKQSTNIEVGDIVYIYVIAPVYAIRYKCVATKVNLDTSDIDDSEFGLEDANYEGYGRYMELTLIERYKSNKLRYQKLKDNGLGTVQGPSKITPQLSAYLFASTETLTGEKITRRKAIEILSTAYARAVTARELTSIIYEVGKHQSAIFGELNYLAKNGILKKTGTPSQYYFTLSKKNASAHYYYVFQGRSFEEEYKGEFLWAPKEGKNHTENHHWSRMEKVKRGDVILHGHKQRFVAVSIAKSDVYLAPRPKELSNEWEKDGWRVDTEYFVFPHAIRPKDYWGALKELLPTKYAPFNKSGDGNQGYLWEANQAMTEFLLDATAGLEEMKQYKSLEKTFEPAPDQIVAEEQEDIQLLESLKKEPLMEAEDDFIYQGKPKKKQASYHRGHIVYPRDRQTAIHALAHAHYLCEIDEAHETFIRKNSDKPYTEPHHFIPMAYSDEFRVSLDVEENIVSLCSNCHNLIHYGKDAPRLLKLLYNARKDALETVGIYITYERLLMMYGIKI